MPLLDEGSRADSSAKLRRARWQLHTGALPTPICRTGYPMFFNPAKRLSWLSFQHLDTCEIL